VKVVEAGPKICRKIGIVTGGFGDLDQVVKAGLDTLITGEVDYPTEVKAKELGINLILGGHRETEVFGVKALAKCVGITTERIGIKRALTRSVTRVTL
jgi:putative NIF3 family GTP cyclohydrolase 1 type 2